jgi:hypothetical protein
VRQDQPNIAATGLSYWGATNFFCGPIELQDDDGNKIPLLIPDVSSMKPYPEYISMNDILHHMPRYKATIMVPPVPGSHGSEFLRNTNKVFLLIYFNLGDYYKPKKPGSYKLTIWPKIYQQSESNKDIYHRIDVPPVSVNIVWKK